MVNERLKEDFMKRLFEIGVFQDLTTSPDGQGFRLKKHETEPDLPLSPYYLDFRRLQSDYDGKMMGVRLFYQMMEALPTIPDLLAAIPEAIVPAISSLSDTSRIPMVTPRTAKNHGSGAKVDGIWKTGMTAVLFDDVVTGAESKFEAYQTMVNAGIPVSDIIVFADREQGGKQTLELAGFQVHTLFTVTELLKFYGGRWLVKPSVLDAIYKYREAEAKEASSPHPFVERRHGADRRRTRRQMRLEHEGRRA